MITKLLIIMYSSTYFYPTYYGHIIVRYKSLLEEWSHVQACSGGGPMGCEGALPRLHVAVHWNFSSPFLWQHDGGGNQCVT